MEKIVFFAPVVKHESPHQAGILACRADKSSSKLRRPPVFAVFLVSLTLGFAGSFRFSRASGMARGQLWRVCAPFFAQPSDTSGVSQDVHSFFDEKISLQVLPKKI